MEGDKVRIIATATDINGNTVYTTEIDEKPQFMLDEEYHEQLIECSCQAVLSACKIIYPNNNVAQKRLASMIANKIEFGEEE